MNAQDLLDQIGAALADDADDLTRQRGVNACRTVLTVLGAQEPMPLPAPSPPLPVPPTPIAAMAPAMPSIPPTAILDAVIAKLQSKLPRDEPSEPEPAPMVLRIPFVPIPTRKGSRS